MKLLKFTIFIFFCMLIASCAKEEEFPTVKVYPIVNTISAEADSTGINAVAEVQKLGAKPITEYGFIYYSNTKTKNYTIRKAIGTSNKKGIYEGRLTADIKKDVIYNVQAYAMVDGFTVYGPIVGVTGLGSALPSVTDFSPKEGFDETLITITGSNFSEDESLVKVKIGTAYATIVEASVERIVIKSPKTNYLGSHPLEVSINNKVVATNDKFTILGPRITHLSKATAKPGEEVTVYGEYLSQTPLPGWNISVSFHGYSAPIKSRTDTEIVFTVPTVSEFLYNRPLTISIAGWNKTVLMGNALTIEPLPASSSFRLITTAPTNLGTLYARMPYFVSPDMVHLFTLDHFVRYNPDSDYWSRGSSFTGEGRSNIVLGFIGHKAFILGGRTASKAFNQVWEYHYPTDTWTRKGDLPFTVYGATSFVLNDFIYFFGGNNSSNTTALWRYDPETGNVVRLKNFPAVTSETGSYFTVDNKIYVVDSDSLYLYDPAQDTWTRINDAPSKGFAYTVNNQGYVLSAATKMLSRYDIAENKWIDLITYPSCITNSAFTGFGYNNRLFVASFTCSMDLYHYQLP